MKLGDTWRGEDGTTYHVCLPVHVREDQPRWWVSMPPPEGNRMLGPATPARLHLLPSAKCIGPAGGKVEFALVLPA